MHSDQVCKIPPFLLETSLDFSSSANETVQIKVSDCYSKQLYHAGPAFEVLFIHLCYKTLRMMTHVMVGDVYF